MLSFSVDLACVTQLQPIRAEFYTSTIFCYNSVCRLMRSHIGCIQFKMKFLDIFKRSVIYFIIRHEIICIELCFIPAGEIGRNVRLNLSLRPKLSMLPKYHHSQFCGHSDRPGRTACSISSVRYFSLAENGIFSECCFILLSVSCAESILQ